MYEFDVSVDDDRTATSSLGGEPITRSDEWWAEHLLLAALVRCTLASLDFHARRAELETNVSGRAHGVVTKRPEDGLYAFVEIEARFELDLSPRPAPAAISELVANVERGCFVGNSLATTPRYRWTVNGEAVT